MEGWKIETAPDDPIDPDDPLWLMVHWCSARNSAYSGVDVSFSQDEQLWQNFDKTS